MDNKRIFTNNTNILIFALICTLLWGSAYPAIKIGYNIFFIEANDIPSKMIFAGYRFLIAGALVLIFSLVINKTIKLPSRKDFFSVFLLGIFQTTFQYLFFYIGLSNTTGVNGAILNATGTFFSVIFAHFIYENDKLNYSKIVGCIVGFLGVIVINFSKGAMNISFNFLGDGFIIIAAIIASGAAIYGKRLCNFINSILVTGYQLLLGGFLLWLLGFSTGGHLSNFNLISTSLLIYMGLLSSIAFTLWTTLLKYNKVGNISVFNFLVPIFGAILSAVFLGENIVELKNLVALILVSFGILVVNRKSN
ncbi:MAG: DMT family transporter [Clostridiaceae bacterium]